MRIKIEPEDCTWVTIMIDNWTFELIFQKAFHPDGTIDKPMNRMTAAPHNHELCSDIIFETNSIDVR